MSQLVKRINHIGIIVPDAEGLAAKLEKMLGLRVSRVEEYGDGELKIVFLPLGETDIELIEPLKPDSNAAQYLEEHGPGIQHIALEVDQLETAMEDVSAAGAELQDKEPRPGAGGTRIAFLESEGMDGLLLELCEVPRDN